MPDLAADESPRVRLLRRLADPAHTAVLTMELQNGVVGPDSIVPALPLAVKAAGILPVAGAVCAAARASGIRVVHCTEEDRADGAGGAVNCRIFALSAKRRAETGGGATDIGTPGARLVDELGLDPRDIIVPRMHGMSPFTSTALDQILRNLGITSIVLTGVSVNLGIFGASMSALDLGYQVLLVRDAVTGIPAEYADAVIDNSLSLITTVVQSQELISLWTSMGA